MKKSHLPLLLVSLLALSLNANAQFKMQTPAGEAPGPWLFGTIGVGKGPDAKTPKTAALKGLAIKVGENGEAAVAYDLDLCRMVGAWTGGKFTTPMNLMSRGEYPTALGEVAFTTPEVAGFQVGEDVGRVPSRVGSTPGQHESTGTTAPSAGEDTRPTSEAWRDPRPEPFGPLPNVRFKGMYVNGGKTVLKWDVGGTEVLEMPGYTVRDGLVFFTRTFHVAPSEQAIWISLFSIPEGSKRHLDSSGEMEFPDGRKNFVGYRLGDSEWVAEIKTRHNQGNWLTEQHGQLKYMVQRHSKGVTFQVVIRQGPWMDSAAAQRAVQAMPVQPDDLAHLTKGGSPLWPESVTTPTELAKSDAQSGFPAAAYVVDTLKLPEPNPWNAPMFIGGFDFFDDGRAAVCTFHGDVFVVDGITSKQAPAATDQLQWRRVASGLYHALGLKVVKGEIYVTCRDGIYRLKDLNGDGETDFYEVFNNDIKVTKNFHEFVFDLHTDSDGYFYFAKAGPVKNGGRGFDQIMSHHGTLLRVTPSGKKMEVMATGFRAPNGIGIGPNGEMTSGDNEGTWTPMCRLNWIKPGGFYGVVDLAHRKETPTTYDRPLCWLPKKVDNSSGSQVWVPDNDRCGPWRGQLLHLSYGQCLLYGVMKEEIIDANAPSCCQSVMQGGVVQFPGLKFESGIMRARFNPIDGQLYVAGLRGWQTNGLKNGCFQRVRYTGAPVRMPIALHAKNDGIEIQFTSSLDTQTAADPGNWSVEAWNYIWSSAYGSPEISTNTPVELGPDGAPTPASTQGVKKERDSLEVKSVQVGTDDRTVFLEIPGLKPAMQMTIKYQLKTADGAELKGDIVNTIHGVSES